MGNFTLVAPFSATGDQPGAINALVKGLQSGEKDQVLLGVTGSGKTFTIASVIERVNRPTLVLAHNKTLAAQLCAEFRAFFPHNAVEYFVSYYDYYQPEAYIASSDIFIEKETSINDEIERLRHSATSSLRERRDVIVVASVSCIYGLGNPEAYENAMISLRPGMQMERDHLLKALVNIQYLRRDLETERGTFRVKGDTVEIIPANEHDKALRVEFFGDTIERLAQVDTKSGHVLATLTHATLFPATHYSTASDDLEALLAQIRKDGEERSQQFMKDNRLLEAQRIAQRTMYDCEMIREIGYCPGIENYSRYFDGRKPGEPPYTLLSYFPKDFLLVIDESHVTVSQTRAMYNGDRARKETLVDYGFRLPAAFDNRPLQFDEFQKKIGQTIYVSATPGAYELARATTVAEQLLRPTGLPDPQIVMRPATGQVDDLIGQLRSTIDAGNRALITTLTKKMSESLSEYLQEMGFRVRYLHSDIKTLERTALLRGLRMGDYDVLVGINLLREGLDLPEVALVAVLDADKEGFLRSETSLIQTIGRAARNADGRVILYADRLTDSLQRAIAETNRRRTLQLAYNEANGITPESVRRTVHDLIAVTQTVEEDANIPSDPEEKRMLLSGLEDAMLSAAANLDFEKAAKLRDQLLTLRGHAPKESTPQFTGRKHPKQRKR